MEKRIQKAKAQRQLYNQSAKSDLAEEVLKILDDESNVDPHSLEKFVEQKIATKTKGLKTKNQRLQAKIKTLEKGAASKNKSRGQGGAAGQKKSPNSASSNNDQRKKGGKGGQGGQSNPTNDGKKKGGGSNSKSNQKKKRGNSRSRKGGLTGRSTQR